MGDHYVLTDLSANGVFLNGATERLARDSQVVLTDGDEFRIGGFVVRVSEGGPPPISAMTQSPPADPLPIDPFEDPLLPPASAGFSHPVPLEVPRPRGFDPFDAVEQERQGPISPEVDRFQGKAADPSWSGAAQRDDVDAANQFYTPPRTVPPVVLSDAELDELLGDLMPPGGASPVTPPPQAAPMVGPTAMPSSPAVVPPAPPQVAAAAPVPPVPAGNPFDEPALPVGPATPATPAVPAGADATRLLTAFLAGAGNPKVELGQTDAEAYFHLVGELMRCMVENLRDVLMSRAEVKRGFGIEQTLLQARNNNALKFSVTPEDAVAAILQPSRPGYLPPLKATEEAFKDLRSHQLAVMAGVQAALSALLKRFDPAVIEAKITSGGRWGNLLPGSGKARYWEMFCATYQEIAREAEEDFQAVFGREFARAYQTQQQQV
jgi:type VI secretion system protein